MDKHNKREKIFCDNSAILLGVKTCWRTILLRASKILSSGFFLVTLGLGVKYGCREVEEKSAIDYICSDIPARKRRSSCRGERDYSFVNWEWSYSELVQ